MSHKFNLFSSVSKNAEKPSFSLRLVFWSTLLTSCVYWGLALLLGSLILSACSGSIFKEDTKAPPPTVSPVTGNAQNANNLKAPPPAAPRTDNTVESSSPNQAQAKDQSVSQANGTLSNSVESESLKAFSFVYPTTIYNLTYKKNLQQKEIFLSKLNMSLTIQNASVGELASVIFALRNSNNDLVTQKISTQLQVTKNEALQNERKILLYGSLKDRDNNTDSPNFYLDIILIDNIVDSAFIHEYSSDKKVVGSYPIHDTDLFDIRIQ